MGRGEIEDTPWRKELLAPRSRYEALPTECRTIRPLVHAAILARGLEESMAGIYKQLA